MVDDNPDLEAAGGPKKMTFKKFSIHGVDLDAILNISTNELVKLFTVAASTRFRRDLTRKPMALIKKLRKLVRIQVTFMVMVWRILEKKDDD
ncbi:40S ribosomal protein S15-4-like [Momordica charantia]|uniref:40S ribosomal protein S15-4-like n=1 Tax=Momordica charantia TaxID=3673 RepID=A0A6J1DUR9_MOMCH|nr:40S ribosomal protein S15-4-like [Momordica charantia]